MAELSPKVSASDDAIAERQGASRPGGGGDAFTGRAWQAPTFGKQILLIWPAAEALPREARACLVNHTGRASFSTVSSRV